MITKYPPQASLSESVRIIKDVFKTHKSKEISIDLLPEIFKIKQRSSNFPATITALTRFGFVEKRPNEILKLTDLAMKIIRPIGENEDIEAKLEAARKDEVLASFTDKYPNYTLPSPDQTKQTLIKLFGINRDTVDKWYQFVFDSFKELGVKRNIIVGENIAITDSEPLIKSSRPRIITEEGFQNFVLPGGKKFSFSLEDGLTLDDLDFITDFFELKKKPIGKGN